MKQKSDEYMKMMNLLKKALKVTDFGIAGEKTFLKVQKWIFLVENDIKLCICLDTSLIK